MVSQGDLGVRDDAGKQKGVCGIVFFSVAISLFLAWRFRKKSVSIFMHYFSISMYIR